MSEYRYAVTKNGRDHAAFVYPRDAYDYVQSEAARKWISIEPVQPGEVQRRRENGQDIIVRDGKHHVDVYPIHAYRIVEIESERRVVGVNGHGYAILDTLARTSHDRS